MKKLQCSFCGAIREYEKEKCECGKQAATCLSSYAAKKPHIIACFPKSFFEKKKLFFQISYTDLLPDGKTSKNTFLKTYDMFDDSFDNALNRMKKEF